MKRPSLVHFLAVMTEDNLSIRASLTLVENKLLEVQNELTAFRPKFPIQAYKLLGADRFTVLITGLDKNHNEIYRKSFESDSFGNLNFKIPLNDQRRKIEVLQVYEVGQVKGLELILGSYIPLKITLPKKIIICDFDKTLVDTRYSSTKEVYRSLTQPIGHFPRVQKSIDKVHEFIAQGFHPFILSASPHFYEEAMRDWLYQNQIYSAGIFLKDYRHILSFFDGDLSPKDIKLQGFYKLGHLLDIILMTGLPDELVLMGDNFESDPLIYLGLSKILKEDLDPWYIWKILKKNEAFRPSKKQNSQILSKIYQLNNMVTQRDENKLKRPKLTIYIRKKADETEISIPEEFTTQKHLIHLYQGHIQQDEILRE